MPRNSSGVYTLPAGNPVVTGTTITTAWANPTMSDIANEVTNSLDRAGRGSMTGQLKAIDGTVAAPGITFGAELSSGWYRAAAGTIRLAILAAQVASFNAAGASITGTFSVSGATTLSSTLGVTGNTTVGGTLGVTGAGTFSSTLGVTGAGTFSSTLGVTGLSNLNGGAAVGSAVAPATYQFRVVSTTGDRLRVVSLSAGNGVQLDVTDAAESTSARPVTLGTTDGTVRLGAATQFIKLADGKIGLGIAAPEARLHAYGNSGTVAIFGEDSSAAGVDIGVRYTAWPNNTRALIGWAESSFTGAGDGGLLLGARGNANAAILFGTLATTRMILTAPGNLGLATTPATGWRSGVGAFQVGPLAAIWTQSNGASNIGFGVYEGGTNTFNYLTTGDAPTLYSQVSGRHQWYNGPAGTANAAATLTKYMELDASGRLLLGAGAPAFGGVLADMRVGTDQNFGILTATLAGTPMTTIAAFTDVGASTNLLIAGSVVNLSGNGGSTLHGRVDGNGVSGFSSTNNQGLAAYFRSGPSGTNGGALNFFNWNNSSADVNLARIYAQTTSGAVGNEAADLLFYTKPSGGALATRLRLSDVGQIFAPSIHNNVSGATGTTPMIASGTYTPTNTNVSGVTALTPNVCQWIRVGNVVHVSGILTASCSSVAGVSWRLTLPISSNLTSAAQLAGTAARSGAPQFGGIPIIGDLTNDAATFSFTNDTNTASVTYSFTFSYLVQ